MSELPVISEVTTPTKAATAMVEEQLTSEAASEGLAEQGQASVLPQKKPQKLRSILTNDFLIGVALSFLLVMIVPMAFSAIATIAVLSIPKLEISGDAANSLLTMGGGVLLFAIILAGVALAFLRRQVFLGMLAGFALLLVASIVFGVFLTAVCFGGAYLLGL
jgi:hypothetical protein